MRNVPDRIPAAEFRHHVSGGEPQGSRAEDEGPPAPDAAEWRDPDHPTTGGTIVVAEDGGEVLDEAPSGEVDCLVCGGRADPSFSLELETPGDREDVAGRVCTTHAGALAGLIAELQRHAGGGRDA